MQAKDYVMGIHFIQEKIVHYWLTSLSGIDTNDFFPTSEDVENDGDEEDNNELFFLG